MVGGAGGRVPDVFVGGLGGGGSEVCGVALLSKRLFGDEELSLGDLMRKMSAIRIEQDSKFDRMQHNFTHLQDDVLAIRSEISVLKAEMVKLSPQVPDRGPFWRTWPVIHENKTMRFW